MITKNRRSGNKFIQARPEKCNMTHLCNVTLLCHDTHARQFQNYKNTDRMEMKFYGKG